MTDSPPRDYLDSLVSKMKSAASPFREVLTEIHARLLPVRDGKVADYIPELAKVNPDLFGISVISTSGQTIEVGDCQQSFSLQSISKPFIFGMALEEHGREHVLERVSIEPSGEAFNSIELDEETNRPFNPLVNTGAIATTDLVEGKDFPDRIGRMLNLFGRYTGREVFVDNAIFISERSSGHRNRAIAHLMLNFGMIRDRVEETLELYFQQCSLMVTCHDLAVMGATLANGGVNPFTGQRALSAEYVRDVLSIMLSCGMYDASGEWGYMVGIPAKSGVGGGIVAVVPGQFGIGVFSPRLDRKGNSVRGVQVFRELSTRYGLHVFEAGHSGPSMQSVFEPRRK